jgi:hypothetical protein
LHEIGDTMPSYWSDDILFIKKKISF